MMNICPVACCLLLAACRLPPAACCLLSAACCLLPAACCLLPGCEDYGASETGTPAASMVNAAPTEGGAANHAPQNEVPESCPLQMGMRMMFNKLSPSDAISMKQSLQAGQKRLLVGTSFSGCEILSKVLSELSHQWTQMLDSTLEFCVLWACEESDSKRNFIRDQFPHIPALFEKMEKLSEVKAFDHVTKKFIIVAWVHIFAAGFTCTSRSRQNSASAGNKGCVRNAESATGVAYELVRLFIARKRPPLVLLENVTPLLEDGDMSDAAYIKESLAKLQYAVEHMVICAEEYGSRTDRQRLFFVAVDISDLNNGSKVAGVFFTLMRNTLQGLKIPRIDLDYFIWDPDGVAEVSHTGKAARMDPLFKDEHLEIFQGEGYDWPPKLLDAPAHLVDVLSQSSERIREVIIFADRKYPFKHPVGAKEFLDANASLSRLTQSSNPWKPNQVPTLTTSAKIVVREMLIDDEVQCYYLHGLCSMALIGWDLPMYATPTSATHEELVHFAGMAFNAFAVGALLIAVFTHWPPRPDMCHRRMMVPSLHSSSHSDGDEQSGTDLEDDKDSTSGIGNSQVP